MEDARFRKRTLNRTKSRMHKYTSQPELQLLPRGRPRYQCQDCGFINTLFPLCLWCPWNPKGPEHELKSTNSRARRASAPARVFLQYDGKNHTTHQHNSQKMLVVTQATDSTDSPLQEDGNVIRLFKHGLGCAAQDGFMQQGNLQWSRRANAIASSEPVATATRTSSVVFAQAQTTRQGKAGPPTTLNLRQENSNSDIRDPIAHSLPSEEQAMELSVDRPLMTLKKRSRNLRLKRSHQILTINIHDTNLMPSSTSDEDDTLSPSVKLAGAKSYFPASPELSEQQQRTLRRRKHLNVLHTSIPDSSTAEPIAISLDLHSPTYCDSKPTQSTLNEDHSRHYTKRLSQPQSATTDSSYPTTPPLTPTLTVTPPSTAPGGLASDDPSSSPVRLGHPSRPYYSAIRKNGISPSTSRPTSLSGPSPPSSSRPQSYTPPSSLNAASTLNSTTSRHLSMSAMFVSPPYSSSPPGVPSAFSVMDDVDNDEEDDMPILPPTPAPGRTRFSLSSDRRRYSHGPILNLHTSPPTHTHSQSLSQVRSKGPRGSVGFSMSGETELRMALAAGAASTGTSGGGGFRYRETVAPPSETLPDIADHSMGTHPRRNSFMGRVRKLRQGLKEILLMTSTTSTTTTA